MKKQAANQVQPVRTDEDYLAELVGKGREILATLEGQIDHPFGDLEQAKSELADWCRFMVSHPVLQPTKRK